MIFSKRFLNYSVGGLPPTYKVMTIKIDQSNTDPATAVTYHDDAVNMIPGSDEWDEFFGHYPVMLLNGVEGKRLDRANRTLYEDGTQADITTGGEGDVMVCFPRRGLKITTEGDIITVSMTDNPNAQANGFEYYAHFRVSDGSIQDKMYVGIYKSLLQNSSICSLKGHHPSLNTLNNHRTNCTNKGANYLLRNLFVNTYLQAMFLLKYKTRDSQSVIGLGAMGIANASIVTGGIETQPMDYGTQNNGDHCNLFGLEDLWGNRLEFINNITLNVNGHFVTNGLGQNDTLHSISSSTMIDGEITNVIGTTKGGFVPYAINATNPSFTTIFTDRGHLICSATRIYTTTGSHEWSGDDVRKAGLFGFITTVHTATHASRLVYV